jgi:hypothetical protein
MAALGPRPFSIRTTPLVVDQGSICREPSNGRKKLQSKAAVEHTPNRPETLWTEQCGWRSGWHSAYQSFCVERIEERQALEDLTGIGLLSAKRYSTRDYGPAFNLDWKDLKGGTKLN